MLPFVTCYPGHTFAPTPARSSPPSHPNQNITSKHCAEKYAIFANKTYGEVLKMYRTSNGRRPRSSELLSENPKSASHHYKQRASVPKKDPSSQNSITNSTDETTAHLGSDNSTIIVPTATSSKRKRAENPWVTDKLFEQIQHGHDLYAKWAKVRKGVCTEGVTDFKGGTCTCPICMEKRSRYNAYNKHRTAVKKLKWEAKVAYYGSVEDFKKKKKDEASMPDDLPSGPSSNDPVESNTTDDLTTVDTTQSTSQPVVNDKPSSGADGITAAGFQSSSLSKPMAMVTAKAEFNPVSQRDFGLQLRCGKFYTVGTDTPSNSEDKAILITNLRHDFNFPPSMMKIVKKYGMVEKLHCRFMKMHHIALVEYKDHKSALRFKMAPGRIYKKHPIIKKFWRKILPVPDSDGGFAAVQAHLAPPQRTSLAGFKKDILKDNKKALVISGSSTAQQSQDRTSQFEMHVPAVVPCLEETGASEQASNAHSFAPKRKPMLKLNQKPSSSGPMAQNVEIIDLDAVNSVEVAKDPVIVVIDDDDEPPCSSLEKSAGPASPCPTATRIEVQKEHEEEIPVIVSSDAFASCALASDTKQSLDFGMPISTPSGLALVPHSFKILPPPDSGMQYVITGSLNPSNELPTTLILRGIPSELNVRKKLSPALTKFGNCKIMPKYLGLRTTTCVIYDYYKDACACFHGAYRLFALEYLKIFWMDTLPLQNQSSASSLTEGSDKSADEVELEIAPGNRKRKRNQYKSQCKAQRKRMRAFKTFRKAYFKDMLDKNYRWRPHACDSVNANLIKKNQTLLSNNINSQKLILTRLESCVDPKSKERLMALLKKLENTHHVTAANLKALRSSTELTNEPSDAKSTPSSSEQKDENTIPTNLHPKSLKIVNFSDQDVLQNHFNKFGKCTVLSYVADKTNVVLCRFEKRKEAVIAFVRGREMTWVEWGNKKEKVLELEWDFGEPIESLKKSESTQDQPGAAASNPSAESTKQSSNPEPTSSSCESKDENPATSKTHPKSIKIVNFSDQDVLQKHFNKFGNCTVLSYVVEKTKVVLCKFERRKEAVIAFSRGRKMAWVEWGNKKEKELELEWDFSD